MRYRNLQIRDALAAEYALGTLQGSVRARFERSMKDDPGLRSLVSGWQQRLAPLDEIVQPVQPPARVWHAIQARIQPRARPRGFWANLGFWRGAALVSSACALALAVYLAMIVPTSGTPQTMVAVMSGEQGTPAMTVSWRADDKRERKLRIRVLEHAEMAPGTSWELWCLPGAEQKPVSLGLIGTAPTQELTIPEPLAQSLNNAYGLAMSVEPEGGSPTGLPTGPVIYKGLTTKL